MPVYEVMGKNEKGSPFRKYSYYKSETAIENLLRYVTRTQKNGVNTNDVVSIGGAGVFLYIGIEPVIQSFRDVQKAYGITSGRRMAHEVFSFSNEDFVEYGCDYNRVILLANEMCSYYFNQGFQVVYAIHHELGKFVHIHFAINAVNYKTGRKYHLDRNGYEQNKLLFQSMFDKYCLFHIIQPISFSYIAS